MYAVNTRFRFRTPVSDAFRQQVARLVTDELTTAPGFRSFYAVAASDRELVTFHVWESQAHAQEGLYRVGEWVRQYIEPELTSALERSAGEIVICVP